MSVSTQRSAANLAKAALRRLAIDQLEPTPEHYARAYALEAGGPAAVPTGPPSGTAVASAAEPAVPLADWIERIVRGLERGGRQWTTARKKDGLQRVLNSSRHDLTRLQQRLTQLLANWERDTPDSSLAELDDTPEPLPSAPEVEPITLKLPPVDAAPAEAHGAGAWPPLFDRLGRSVQVALPAKDGQAVRLADELAALTARLLADGAGPDDAQALAELCGHADLLLQHRHHLMDLLGQLCEELSASLGDLAENDSWARGQCEAMRLKLEEGLNARGIKAVSELLRDTRVRQGRLRAERELARDALKGFINQLLNELGDLGQHTGRFHESVGRYAEVIERADTLESLADVVREMVIESRTVEGLVGQAQQRLQQELARATELSEKVHSLEAELKRLSDEVSTDQLTQVANRRGLMSSFEVERARQTRDGSTLCIALLDVDNFKRLNDELGHGAGDEALKSLAALVSRTLRPTDLVARYGGEEFVLLLPGTTLPEARQVLDRLQRALTGGLFMHETRQVFVTFSAGVTVFRPGEPLEAALDRADQALYQAKRTGKNRSCSA
jgi:diguanylate cyclase